MVALRSVKHCYKGPATARSVLLFIQRAERLSSLKAMTASFIPGQTYYGSLACAHSSFPVVCVKRTEKSVWFEHANSEAYKPARAKAHKWTDGSESANFHNWYISSDSIKDNGWDMQLV
jgi:hypothetical protein